MITGPFSARLKVCMEASSITPVELAKRASLDLSAVYHFTSGRREPSLGTLDRILRAMPRIDARYLVTGIYSPEGREIYPELAAAIFAAT